MGGVSSTHGSNDKYTETLVEKSAGMKPLERGWEDNIKMYFKEIDCEG
jgi:hypothetical protein